MDIFKCHICGLDSPNKTKVIEHLQKAHNFQVEDDALADTFMCPQCTYITRNMADMKKHMTNIHKKDEWNWGLEIRLKFICGECELEFTTKSMLRNHVESGHNEVGGSIVEDTPRKPYSGTKQKNTKIEPDVEFLTRNTKDLEIMLKALPLSEFYTAEEDFQKDFNDILNENKEEEDDTSTSVNLKCPDCNFKASSRKVLKTHIKFVHDMTFHVCDVCGTKTKTVGAMKVHKWNKHKVIFRAKQNQKQEVRGDPMVSDSSESAEESSDSDFDELPNLYQEKDWKGGYSFKSRTPAFEKAASGLKILLKKTVKVQQIDDIKIRVIKVSKQGEARMTDIEITDIEGTGEVHMHTWGPNKRTRKITIGITKSSKGERKHVDIVAKKVVKPLLDRLLKGETTKTLLKTFFVNIVKQEAWIDSNQYSCPICHRKFPMERGMKSHITKMHKSSNIIYPSPLL